MHAKVKVLSMEECDRESVETESMWSTKNSLIQIVARGP